MYFQILSRSEGGWSVRAKLLSKGLKLGQGIAGLVAVEIVCVCVGGGGVEVLLKLISLSCVL